LSAFLSASTLASVQLEHLFDGELVYSDRGRWVQPYREDEWLGWAEGTGTLSGPRLSGRIRWLNHPRQRPDQTWLPDYHCVIETEDGDDVFARLRGLNLFEEAEGEYHGTIVMSAEFAADSDRYRWLNRTFGVVEAVASAPLDLDDPRTERWQLRAYGCKPELE
jgi:hypothetical protein